MLSEMVGLPFLWLYTIPRCVYVCETSFSRAVGLGVRLQWLRVGIWSEKVNTDYSFKKFTHKAREDRGKRKGSIFKYGDDGSIISLTREAKGEGA